MKYRRAAVVFALQDKLQQSIDKDTEALANHKEAIAETLRKKNNAEQRLFSIRDHVHGLDTAKDIGDYLVNKFVGYNAEGAQAYNMLTGPMPEEKDEYVSDETKELRLIVDIVKTTPDEFIATRELQQLGLYKYLKKN